MYNSSKVFQEFHCIFQPISLIMFYNSYFLPQLIFSVRSLNNPVIDSRGHSRGHYLHAESHFFFFFFFSLKLEPPVILAPGWTTGEGCCGLV